MSDNQNLPISNHGSYDYQEVLDFYRQLRISKEVANGMSLGLSQALQTRHNELSYSLMTSADVDAIAGDAKSDAGWAAAASHLPFIKSVSDTVIHTIGQAFPVVKDAYSAAQGFVEMKNNSDQGNVVGGIKNSIGIAGDIGKLADLGPAAKWAKMSANAIGLEKGIEDNDPVKIIKEGGKIVGEVTGSDIIKTGADLVGDYNNLVKGDKTIEEGYDFKIVMDDKVNASAEQVKHMIENVNAKTDTMRDDVSNLIGISKTGSHPEIDEVLSEIESKFPGIADTISHEEIATEANAFRDQVIKYAGTSSYKVSDEELDAYRSNKNSTPGTEEKEADQQVSDVSNIDSNQLPNDNSAEEQPENNVTEIENKQMGNEESKTGDEETVVKESEKERDFSEEAEEESDETETANENGIEQSSEVQSAVVSDAEPEVTNLSEDQSSRQEDYLDNDLNEDSETVQPDNSSESSSKNEGQSKPDQQAEDINLDDTFDTDGFDDENNPGSGIKQNSNSSTGINAGSDSILSAAASATMAVTAEMVNPDLLFDKETELIDTNPEIINTESNFSDIVLQTEESFIPEITDTDLSFVDSEELVPEIESTIDDFSSGPQGDAEMEVDTESDLVEDSLSEEPDMEITEPETDNESDLVEDSLSEEPNMESTEPETENESDNVEDDLSQEPVIESAEEVTDVVSIDNSESNEVIDSFQMDTNIDTQVNSVSNNSIDSGGGSELDVTIDSDTGGDSGTGSSSIDFGGDDLVGIAK